MSADSASIVYVPPRIPDQEAARLETLRALEVLDTDPEETFDDIVELASYICDAPISLLTLVDEERQWFKARRGVDICQTDRDISFCAHAIHSEEPFVVEDAKLDARFAGNPLVTDEPHIRFYAGFPLVLDGLALGSLCVIDRRPRRLDQGQIQAMQRLARQATDLLEMRRTARRLAHEKHERKLGVLTLDELTRNIPEVFWITSIAADEVLYLSPGFENLWEMERREVYDNPDLWLEFIHPDDLERVRDELARAIDHQHLFESDYRIITRDGSVKWIRTRSFPVVLDGELDRIAGLSIEISDHKDIERRLEERASQFRDQAQWASQQLSDSRTRYEVLFENSNDPIVVFDLNGCIIEHNDRASEMLGSDGPSLEGLHFSYLLAEASDPSVKDAWRRALAGESVRLELPVLRSDGSLRIGQVSARRVDLGNEQVVQVIFRDRTQRKEAQERLEHVRQQLWQAQKMDAMGQLAGGVAHDFNNMLAVISVASDMLLSDMDEDDPHRRDVEDISEATDRSASLTRQLLAFSRQQSLTPQIVHLDGNIRQMQRLLERLLPASIDFQVRLNAGELDLYVDPGQLEQVLVNLVVNARDAFEDGTGRITVETRTRHVEQGAHPRVPAGAYGVVTVSDNGVGIPAGIRERIFEPFFTTKAEDEGTGLGLATVHGIVKQSGGYIELDSEAGRGTDFAIWLPRATDEQLQAALDRVEKHSASTGSSQTLLLIEDNALVRSSMARVLRYKGYEILEAADGEEALELWQEERARIDAIVSDIGLPGLGGPALLEHLRRDAPFLPALFVTGYPEADCLDIGCDERTQILRKPTKPAALHAALSDILDCE